MEKEQTKETVFTGNFIANYLDYATNITDAPEEFNEAMALNLLSLAIGRVPILLKPILFPNVWVILVGESYRSRKTSAINIALKVLPTEVRDTLPNSFTPESLCSSLSEHPQGLIWTDEIGGLLRDIKIKDYMKGTSDLLTALYNCPEHFARRIRSADFNLDRPCFNVVGGTQPINFTSKEDAIIKSEDFQTEFLSRFLIVYGERKERKPRSRWTKDDDSRLIRIQELWKKIFDYFHGGNVGKIVFDYTDEALALYNQWEEARDKEIQAISDARERQVKTALMRISCDYAIKLSALYEIDLSVSKLAEVLKDNVLQISADSLKKALGTMGKYSSLLTANLLILLTDNTISSKISRISKDIETHVSLSGWTTRTSMLRYSAFRNANDLNEALALAFQADLIEQEKIDGKTCYRVKPVMPRPRFEPCTQFLTGSRR